MKKLILLMLLLPLFANAQTDPNEKKSDGKFRFISAAKTVSQPAVRKENSPKKLKDDEVYTGAVKFKTGSNEINCDSAISFTNEGIVMAYHVSITNPESFDIQGDVLNYNKDDNTGTLTNNITVTAKNGNVVGTSDNFKIDFSYEIYRVINGAITPPKQN